MVSMTSRRRPLCCCSGRLCWLARRRPRRATPRNQPRRPRSCRCSAASRPSDSMEAAAATQVVGGGEELACLRCLRRAPRVSLIPATAVAVVLEAWSARGAPPAESYGQSTMQRSPRAETAAAALLRGWFCRSPRRLQSACDLRLLRQMGSRRDGSSTDPAVIYWTSASAKLVAQVGTHAWYSRGWGMGYAGPGADSRMSTKSLPVRFPTQLELET